MLLFFPFSFFLFCLLAFRSIRFFALVVFVDVCTQWGPHPPKEHSSCEGRMISLVRSRTLSFVFVLQYVFVYVSVHTWFVFYLAWSTYPGGLTDNTCGINQINQTISQNVGPPSSRIIVLLPVSPTLRRISVEPKTWIIASLHGISPKRSLIDVVRLTRPEACLTARHNSFWASLNADSVWTRVHLILLQHHQHASSPDFLIRVKCGPKRAWPDFIR
jgi:hypothetical protein